MRNERAPRTPAETVVTVHWESGNAVADALLQLHWIDTAISMEECDVRC